MENFILDNKCPSGRRSSITNECLKKIVTRCRKGICYVYEVEQSGSKLLYSVDNRSFLQKHSFEIFIGITFCISGFLLSKYF